MPLIIGTGLIAFTWTAIQTRDIGKSFISAIVWGLIIMGGFVFLWNNVDPIAGLAWFLVIALAVGLMKHMISGKMLFWSVIVIIVLAIAWLYLANTGPSFWMNPPAPVARVAAQAAPAAPARIVAPASQVAGANGCPVTEADFRATVDLGGRPVRLLSNTNVKWYVGAVGAALKYIGDPRGTNGQYANAFWHHYSKMAGANNPLPIIGPMAQFDEGTWNCGK